ncbi:hypothetical protein X737_03490 [Mesorhizobium sp. L48C026A00]|nr:hypothetical protein X737_03490 [Mesorhizobium sp. L48C026A00]
MADFSRGKPHRRAGDRRLADVEWCAAAADAATHGDQAGFRAAQEFCFRRQAGFVPEADDIVANRLRQRRHDGLALKLLIARFLSSHG